MSISHFPKYNQFCCLKIIVFGNRTLLNMHLGFFYSCARLTNFKWFCFYQTTTFIFCYPLTAWHVRLRHLWFSRIHLVKSYMIRRCKLHHIYFPVFMLTFILMPIWFQQLCMCNTWFHRYFVMFHSWIYLTLCPAYAMVFYHVDTSHMFGLLPLCSSANHFTWQFIIYYLLILS